MYTKIEPSNNLERSFIRGHYSLEKTIKDIKKEDNTTYPKRKRTPTPLYSREKNQEGNRKFSPATQRKKKAKGAIRKEETPQTLEDYIKNNYRFNFDSEEEKTQEEREEEGIQFMEVAKSIASLSNSIPPKKPTWKSPAPMRSTTLKGVINWVNQVWKEEGSELDKLVLDQGFNINRSNIKSLQMNAQLTDNVIDYYLELLKKELPNNDYLILDTTLIQYLRSEFSYFKNEQSLHERFFNRDSISKITIIPVNIAGEGSIIGHWVLITVDPRKKEINYLDSFGAKISDSKVRTDFSLIKDWFEKGLKHLNIKTSQDFSNKRWSINTPIVYFQGIETVDCGIYILLYTEYMLKNLDYLKKFSTGTISAMRYKIAYSILNKKYLVGFQR